MTSLNQRLINLESNAGTTTGTRSGTITIANVENLQTTLDTKQNSLTAGDNITIENNVISSSGGGTLPSNANFSSVTADTGNFSTINASTITTSGDVTTGDTLFIGTNDNSTTPKRIKFGGLQGDNGYDLAVIENRVYDLTEKANYFYLKATTNLVWQALIE